jgi:hypothetical protein
MRRYLRGRVSVCGQNANKGEGMRAEAPRGRPGSPPRSVTDIFPRMPPSHSDTLTYDTQIGKTFYDLHLSAEAVKGRGRGALPRPKCNLERPA